MTEPDKKSGAPEPPGRALVGVVEDNPDNRLVVRAMLRRHFDLIEFEEGASALAGFDDRRPDVVLLDISLPGMDGPEVLRRIRADAGLASIPVVALTAHAMTGNREELLALGFDDYVPKPILDPADLVARIRALVDGAAASG